MTLDAADQLAEARDGRAQLFRGPVHVQEHLGTTLFGQRKLAFAASATEDG